MNKATELLRAATGNEGEMILAFETNSYSGEIPQGNEAKRIELVKLALVQLEQAERLAIEPDDICQKCGLSGDLVYIAFHGGCWNEVISGYHKSLEQPDEQSLEGSIVAEPCNCIVCGKDVVICKNHLQQPDKPAAGDFVAEMRTVIRLAKEGRLTVFDEAWMQYLQQALDRIVHVEKENEQLKERGFSREAWMSYQLLISKLDKKDCELAKAKEQVEQLQAEAHDEER